MGIGIGISIGIRIGISIGNGNGNCNGNDNLVWLTWRERCRSSSKPPRKLTSSFCKETSKMLTAIFYMAHSWACVLVHSRIHVQCTCTLYMRISCFFLVSNINWELPSGFPKVKLSPGKVQHMLMLTMNENQQKV